MKRIAMLTRDCAGMNACIRAVVRAADLNEIEVYGVFRGYDGLMDNELKPLTRRSVSNIINTGGTILKTARALRFKTFDGQQLALKTIEENNIDGLIIAGGNGTLSGAYVLADTYHIPVVGIPATIDNDINGIDLTLGADTAVNVAMDALDKIRDTATSLERIFVVEVMGRDCGYIAIQTALAGGCEEVLFPEQIDGFAQDLENDFYPKMCKEIQDGAQKGKRSWIVIAAEGKAKAVDIARYITKKTGLETREIVLGHIQRGGRPTAFDRILAGRLGVYAVECLRKNITGVCVHNNNRVLAALPLAVVAQPKSFDFSKDYQLIKILT